MRTLLILGVLVVCGLLVTPSNGDRMRTGQDGGEMKLWDYPDWTVPADTSDWNMEKLPCCVLPGRGPCKLCSGGGDPISRFPSDDVAIYQMKLRNYPDRTVPAESSESNLKPLPCCGRSTRVLCQPCSGEDDPISRFPSDDVIYEEFDP
ncbi:uncharacterized protein LOC143997799 isoform X1 [Lithobates pipiens]